MLRALETDPPIRLTPVTLVPYGSKLAYEHPVSLAAVLAGADSTRPHARTWRLVERTAPDHEYYPESRAIGHAGTPP